MSRSRIQRIAAMVLVLGILPLSLFAAVSMGLRIDQHGLSPERIWALIAIAVAVAYGLAGLVVVVRGRLGGWSGLLRRANLNLAVGGQRHCLAASPADSRFRGIIDPQSAGAAEQRRGEC